MVEQPKKVERCQTCGFRKRGSNHDEGPHHKGQRGSGNTDPKRIQEKKRWD